MKIIHLKHPYHRKKGRCKGANLPEALGTEIQAIAFLRTTTCPACVNFFVDLKNGPRSETHFYGGVPWPDRNRNRGETGGPPAI
jgi:hypothetical protein